MPLVQTESFQKRVSPDYCRNHHWLSLSMNRLSERGQPCPRESRPKNLRTWLSALLSVGGLWLPCAGEKPWKPFLNRCSPQRSAPDPGAAARRGSWQRVWEGVGQITRPPIVDL